MKAGRVRTRAGQSPPYWALHYGPHMEYLAATANGKGAIRRRRAFDRADVEDQGAADDRRGRSPRRRSSNT